jgi:hypothetical protein
MVFGDGDQTFQAHVTNIRLIFIKTMLVLRGALIHPTRIWKYSAWI